MICMLPLDTKEATECTCNNVVQLFVRWQRYEIMTNWHPSRWIMVNMACRQMACVSNHFRIVVAHRRRIQSLLLPFFFFYGS